jgi:hypothetical protein
MTIDSARPVVLRNDVRIDDPLKVVLGFLEEWRFDAIFERFEVLVTLISLLSDFIAICIFVILILRCLTWLFNLKDCFYLCIPLAMIIFYLTYYVSSTQFEFRYLYRYVIVNLNLIFEYAIPVILFLLCLIKRKKIKKPY